MKKLAIAATFTLLMPIMANAATYPLAFDMFILDGIKNSVSLQSKGLCFGTLKFSGKGKINQATPGFNSSLNAALIIGASDQQGGTFTWNNDRLLDHRDPASGLPDPAPVELIGDILVRKNNTLTLGYPSGADQLKVATALLAYAGSFSDQLANAVLDTATATKKKTTPLKIVAKFTKNGDAVKVTETSYVVSNQGSCQSSAKIVRTFYGTHAVP
jgi:hypothetical protein